MLLLKIWPRLPRDLRVRKALRDHRVRKALRDQLSHRVLPLTTATSL